MKFSKSNMRMFAKFGKWGLHFTTLLAVPFLTPMVHAVESPIPDFYTEGGVSADRPLKSDNANEVIDPFSGALSLVHTDMVIPGNGGLDLEIKRVYTHIQGDALGFRPKRSTFGMGWTMHFGRVIFGTVKASVGGGTTSIADVCGLTSPTTLDNSVFELPDGSRQILAEGKSYYNVDFITQKMWKGECLPNGASYSDGSRTSGLAIYSPSGMRYELKHAANHYDGRYLYVTRISNMRSTRASGPLSNGEPKTWMDISYKKVGKTFTESVVDKISTSDGRRVQFVYQSPTSDRVRLKYVEAEAGLSTALPGTCPDSKPVYRWQYHHRAAETLSGIPYWHLSKVTRPDGTTWQYEYYIPRDKAPGTYSLKTLIYPYGGETSYTYQHVNFDQGNTIDSFFNAAIESKTTSGNNGGNWNWRFTPGTYATNFLDQTEETTPKGKNIYTHYGYAAALNSPQDELWKVGTMLTKEITQGSTTVQRETYSYVAKEISKELYIRPTRAYNTSLLDGFVAMPVLTKKTIRRDGTNYVTEYSRHDKFANPGLIREGGNHSISGDGSGIRTTELTYYINEDLWIVGAQKDVTVGGYPVTLRTYGPSGLVESATEDGVTAFYTYTAEGDVATVRDGRGNTTAHSDYYRGQARSEMRPEGVTISQYVSSWGAVSGIRNGEGVATCYQHDDMLRLSDIVPTLSAPISFARTDREKQVRRQSYEESYSFDGYGRTIDVTRKKSKSSTGAIVKNFQFDAFGNTVFESYPNSAFGTATRYDVLNRPTRVSHGDDSVAAYEYRAGNIVSIVNERGFETLYYYRSYGDPDEKLLWRIEADKDEWGNTLTTSIQRDVLGRVTSVSIDNITRSYEYHPTTFNLIRREEPETGVTLYDYDEAGNLTCRAIGTLHSQCTADPEATRYEYDGLNRRDKIDYPEPTPDVQFKYDKNNNILAITNGVARNDYVYNSNGSLKSEEIQIGGMRYAVTHEYNQLDHRTATVYPSGFRVDYEPDVFGRPTRVGDVISQVEYFPNGMAKTLVYGDGNTARMELDIRLRPAAMSYKDDYLGRHVRDEIYVHDGAGNLVEKRIAYLDAIENTSIFYEYDGIDRLTKAGSKQQGDWRYFREYTYSDTGNLTQVNWKRMAVNANPRFTQFQYDDNNRMVGFLDNQLGWLPDVYKYDARGNWSAADWGDSTGRIEHTWDHAGNLIDYWNGVIRYWYDGRNRMVKHLGGSDLGLTMYSQDDKLLVSHNRRWWQATDKLSEYIYLGNKLVGIHVSDVVIPTPLLIQADPAMRLREVVEDE